MREQPIVFVCLLMLVAAAPVSAQTQQQIDRCNGKGSATPDLRISGCTAVIQAAGGSGKNLASVFLNRAISYAQKREYDRAIDDFSKAIQLEPQNANAFYNRGVIYQRKGRHDRAIEDYSQAIRVNPKHAPAFNNRCYARAVLGRELRKALADCDESLRLRPNYANTFDSRGLAHIKLGQFERAIADYSTAIRLDPKDASALYGRGFVKRKKGDAAGAAADMAAAKAIQADIAEEYAKFGLK